MLTRAHRLLLSFPFLAALAACGVQDDMNGDVDVSDIATGGTVGVAPALQTSGIGFVTASGAEVVLRGVDVQGDAPAAVYQQATDLGANFLRVVTHWDEAETEAPTGSGTNWASYTHHWNAAYLAKLDALIAWAEAHHIYTLIDVHQASWSPYFDGFGGVPTWYYQDHRFAGGKYAAGSASNDKGRAIGAFWTTEAAMSQPLFEAFAQMMVRRYSAYAHVVGYEIFNEPNPGNLSGTPAAKTATMTRWQVPVRDAIYALDGRRAIFFMHRGGGSGVGTADWSVWGNMPAHHMVLDVHAYYTGESPGKNASHAGAVGLDPAGDDWVPNDGPATHNNLRTTGAGGQNYNGSQQYQEALYSVWIAKAHAAGIPLVLGEWGCNENDTGNAAYHSQVVHAAASVGLSWSRWQLASSSSSSASLNLSEGTTSYENLKNLLRTVPPGTPH
jgi:hypothetical protein